MVDSSSCSAPPSESLLIDRFRSAASINGCTGNPITYVMKFLAFGEGDTAPVTREVLRKSEPNPLRRPRVHVG